MQNEMNDARYIETLTQGDIETASNFADRIYTRIKKLRELGYSDVSPTMQHNAIGASTCQIFGDKPAPTESTPISADSIANYIGELESYKRMLTELDRAFNKTPEIDTLEICVGECMELAGNLETFLNEVAPNLDVTGVGDIAILNAASEFINEREDWIDREDHERYVNFVDYLNNNGEELSWQGDDFICYEKSKFDNEIPSSY